MIFLASLPYDKPCHLVEDAAIRLSLGSVRFFFSRPGFQTVKCIISDPVSDLTLSIDQIILYQDWDDQNVGSIISEICGFIVVLSGTIVLHTTREFERSSSFRGALFRPFLFDFHQIILINFELRAIFSSFFTNFLWL